MTKKGNNIFLDPKNIIIIILIIALIVMGFFLGKYSNKNTSETENSTLVTSNKDLKVTVVGDSRCELCDEERILEQFKQAPFLQDASFTSLDYSENESDVKELLEQNAITTLPTILFSTNEIANAEDFVPILVETKAGNYTINQEGFFNPNTGYYVSEFSCEDGKDDDNNGKIDCEDTACSLKPICRSEEKGKLDVFLMGFCPFGELAAKSIPSLQDKFGDNLDIDVHFIATKIKEGNTSEAFDSLHGVTEAEEDIRQLCIKRDYGINKLIEYFQERYKNADNYGRVNEEASIAYTSVGIDGEKIEECINNGEGAKLLEEDVKLAEELGITASPTWLANNKYTFGGIEASAIQTEFCKYNSELEGCSTTIESSAATSGANPSCN